MLKKIATPLILASFLMMAFFGFVTMSQGSDGRMENNCPFSATGATLCPQNAVAVVLHHISAYQSFLATPVGPNPAVLLVVFFVLSVTPILFRNFFIPIAFAGLLYKSPPAVSYNRKLMHWFSLFELSPAS